MSAQRFSDTATSFESVRVSLSGEIDCATASGARSRLRAAARDNPGAEIVVDMSGVSFLDCAGVSALVDARHEALRSGGQLRLANVRRGPLRTLALTGTNSADYGGPFSLDRTLLEPPRASPVDLIRRVTGQP